MARLVVALARRGVQTTQVHSSTGGTAVLRVEAPELSDQEEAEEAHTAQRSATVMVDNGACTVDVVADSRALEHIMCLHALTASVPTAALL